MCHGLTYVVTEIDCFSTRVLSLSIAGHISVELVEDVLRDIAQTAVFQEQVIFHSDTRSGYIAIVNRTFAIRSY